MDVHGARLVIFDAIFMACWLGQLGLLVWSSRRAAAFLESTPLISDEEGLGRLKTFVRTQMYGALVPLVLMPPGVAMTLTIARRHGVAGMGVVVAAGASLAALIGRQKRWEARVRSLEVRPEFRDESRRVMDAWIRKALPTF